LAAAFRKPAKEGFLMSVDAHTETGRNDALLELPLDRILVDPSLQPRVGGLDADHVVALQECPESWPSPVVVERSGYMLVDGFHRYAAAQNLGLQTIPVEVREMPADGDLRALAFALNIGHGRPLTLADRRDFAAYLLRQHAQWSDREVGRQAGLSQPTVARVRSALEASAQIEQTETRVGRGGYTYSPAREEQRQPGELPADQESLTDRLFTAKDRRDQRHLARYFERLAVALDDQFDFESWRGADDAAEACRAVFGDGEAAELAERLAVGCRNVLDVAEELGHRPAE
jgi:hypothetical protein